MDRRRFACSVLKLSVVVHMTYSWALCALPSQYCHVAGLFLVDWRLLELCHMFLSLIIFLDWNFPFGLYVVDVDTLPWNCVICRLPIFWRTVSIIHYCCCAVHIVCARGICDCTALVSRVVRGSRNPMRVWLIVASIRFGRFMGLPHVALFVCRQFWLHDSLLKLAHLFVSICASGPCGHMTSSC